MPLRYKEHRVIIGFDMVMVLLVQVDRHLRKLDQELSKFKMELEADNAGITEVLEKRKYDIDILGHKHA